MPLPIAVDGRVSRLSVLGLALALALAGPGPAAQGAGGGPVTPGPGDGLSLWPKETYNPSPLDGDLILPLPCGGAIAFRPVVTPLGTDRTDVMGPFGDTGTGAERYLLIGKYEVAALQYAAVAAQAAGQPCPDPRERTQGALAQVGVSKIDAVNFADRLSRWLHANARAIPPCRDGAGPCLPRVDGKPAFVRLALEAEWEYAARGGAAVSDDDFARARYPMPEGLGRHAWYRLNSDGEIAPIGRRLASPLGLHDLYGNAWEIVGDPFQSERFPGQIGGDTLRGGGVHSTDEELAADRRVEVQPYDSAGAVKTADTGFRVALAVPVVTSMARLPATDAAGDRVPASRARPNDTDAYAAPPSQSIARPQVPVPPSAPAPAFDGQLTIRVDTSAIVLVDGEIKGAAGIDRPLAVAGVQRGMRRVEARAAGYPNSAAIVDVRGAEPVEVRIHMEPTPARAETLLKLTGRERRAIRQQLVELGMVCDIDEAPFAEDVRRLLREVQRQAGLAPTGYVTAETRAAIERRAQERGRARAAAEAEARDARDLEDSPLGSGARFIRMPAPSESRWMDPDVP